jgi:hypothetical protein
MYLNAFLDPDEQVDTAELANLICSDASVSNVIKVGTEVMGFAAVLPFAPLRNSDLGQQLQRIVLARAPAAMQAALTAAFANDRLGLLVSERTLNCPPQLVPHLHSLLHEEVHNTGDETDTFRLDQLLMIGALFVSGQAARPRAAVDVARQHSAAQHGVVAASASRAAGVGANDRDFARKLGSSRVSEETCVVALSSDPCRGAFGSAVSDCDVDRCGSRSRLGV